MQTPPPQPAPTAPVATTRLPLAARLLLLILAVAVPPLVGLGLAMMNVNEGALLHSARELHLSIALDVRRALREELERARQQSAAIGYLMLAPDVGTQEEREKLADSQLAFSTSLDFVSFYSLEGERLGTLKARGVAEPDTPATLPTALLTEVPEQGLRVLGLTMAGELPSLRVLQRASVEGKPLAYLLTHVRLKPLVDQLQVLSTEWDGLEEGVYVVDAERRVVLHPTRSRLGASLAESDFFAAIGREVSFHSDFVAASDFEAEMPMFGALVTVPEVGWAIVVQRSQPLTFKTLRDMRLSVGLALGLCALVALVGAWLGARQLSRPIQALVRATRSIAARSFTQVEGEVETRADELGHLGRSLGEMARSLESSEKELVEQTRVRTALSRYLSADVVELIAREPGRLRLGGERREVTVLFSDVCGFTRLSESLPPETVVALLNELFTFATEIIHRRGGIIDKFIGDSVMAVWGTPESHPDDARQAVEAAMELRRWVETGNRRWRQKWGVEIQLAMGLHTGTVVAGNLGSEKRMEYTVIGDAVNVAARLESMAQPGQILVSAATRERLGEEAEVLRHLGERALHGRNATTQVFEVAA
ncbi:adenylate/guanylate cyclase domain-containing protein [Hyalangium rubrum]|uniref:Adenylate/guanylate cyclase domain-containing protein n=1 Tax=Hyalangium rubrum TaxID=3103134 RepID=A0ABU5HGH0_9BACT|nr:adenylate/guanylate cyclase domain-containing protein [Hyalangium sp. s54d21]MDY7232336.1 adenylate/guanylate cyclase domain-containing protein [Hyalangium sp. s54d21]